MTLAGDPFEGLSTSRWADLSPMAITNSRAVDHEADCIRRACAQIGIGTELDAHRATAFEDLTEKIERFLSTGIQMSSISAISLSGMNAAQTSLDASAHNIANVATGGFRRQLVAQAMTSSGGVTTSLAPASEPGNAIETDMVGQLAAKNLFLANLAVFRASDKMLGALLDTKT